jgi:hypothetical protein
MRNRLLLLPLWFFIWGGPALAQPWLECAEVYLPAAVEQDSREAYLGSLVHGYARNGQFARTQALIDAAPAPAKNSLGALAAVGALSGQHVDQALRWGQLYLPADELSWDQPEHLSSGSDRERFLRSPRSPEDAARVLEFLRSHGGVSPSSLVFVLREIGGMPMAVSDFYFREFAKMADQARPVDWIQMEESVEASGEEFLPLRERILTVMLESREQLIDELAATTSATRPQLENGMTKYTATLLARHGRFQEAEEMWQSAGPSQLSEQKAYLQNQYLGGRHEQALAELIKLTGLEEDAKVQLSLFLFGLGHFEEVKALGTDPDDYVDSRIARRDLERSKNIDKWLPFLARLDVGSDPTDSQLFKVAQNKNMPAAVRQAAWALLPDPAASIAAAQKRLMRSVNSLSEADAARITLMLLILDEDINELGCPLPTEGLEIIEALQAKAPLVSDG